MHTNKVGHFYHRVVNYPDCNHAEKGVGKGCKLSRCTLTKLVVFKHRVVNYPIAIMLKREWVMVGLFWH